MSGTFKGFSEKEIENMKKNSNGNENKKVISVLPNKKKVVVKTLSKGMNASTENFEPIDDGAKLSAVKNDSLENVVNAEDGDFKEVELQDNETNNNVDKLKKENSLENLSVIADNIIKLEKPIKIEEFQIQQKLMEEQNKKRKEMLAKALEDREKQTVEETIRIDKIKKELQSLDAQLSGDVAILRKKIDKCSVSFAEAEKNYHKIEMEFLAAKMNLQKEKERKEMLTEHLCTLIAHNEARKAKKLEFLMDQLAYKTDSGRVPSVVDGVCEQTGKMLEIENGEVVLRDDVL